MSAGEKLKENREVRGMEGGQEGELRDGGGDESEMGRGGAEILGRRQKEGWRERERDECRRRQQSEFIFINGQRAERELLKRKKMNERMSVKEGRGGDKGRCDICLLPAL